VHVLFAIVIIGSLAAKSGSTEVLSRNGNFEPAVIRTAELNGWAFRDHSTIDNTDLPILVFDVPNCAQPVLVSLVLVTFDGDSVIRSARRPGYGLRYFYIDREWDAPNRLGLFIERAKYAALAVVGRTQYVPSADVLLVQAPLDCRLDHEPDWRPVWRRDSSSARWDASQAAGE